MKTKIKFSKQILSILLCLAMLMSYVPAFSLTAHAATTNAYDGTPVTPTQITESNYAAFGLTADNWSGYSGYYGIRTAAELYGFANLVNSSKNRYCSYECAVLLADIVVNSGTVTEAGSSSGTTYDWIPIGLGTYNSSNIYGAPYFTGTFDGNGHTISGLYCNTTDSKVGLFSYTGYSEGATIKNVIIANSYFGGSSYVGGIVGYAFWNTTNITNCKVSSDVIVKGTDRFVGGILGGAYLSDIADDRVNDNEITNCVNFGTVKTTASTNAVGGIAGSWAAETDYQRGVVSCTNCYYLANCASNASGTVNWACGTYATGTGWADNTGCTALDSANASHNHINVTHKEVNATCLYEGLSSYSFCLICDTETSGTKTVYGIDADNHSSHSLTYKEYDEYTHNVYHACCDALSENTTHTYTGGNCVTSEVCSLCKRVGSTCPDIHASTETVMKVMPEDTSRHATYHKCCTTLISGTEAGHTYVDGVCSVCAYNCQHKNIVDGFCDACGEESVKYLHREWNGTQVVSTIKDTSGMPTIVTSATTTMSSGWYIVNGDVTISSTIVIDGTVHLILADGAHLNAKKGIQVENSNAIYIYSQSAETGRLTATSSTSAYYHGVAGIGSHNQTYTGTIVINGGIISATGGESRYAGAAAGIGGSGYDKSGGNSNITINGGIITANGSKSGTYVACGIGGGMYANGGDSCTIMINGGTITTNNGIGGRSGSSVTITGGNINSKTVNVTPKDKNGNTVSQQTLTVNGAANNTPVTELEGVENYGLTNVVTLNDKLYFYLPSGAAAETITAGGEKYNCNSDNTFYKEHSWVEATCVAPKQCSNCGIAEGTALAHNYVNGVCENCGIGENGHFYISNVNHLMAFAKYVNTGNKNAKATLMADIDLSGYDWDIICETGLYYNGYGNDLGYAGTFDGNGHVIKNISVKSSTTIDASCGLFGTVSGTIKNLGIEGFTFVDGGKDIRTGAIVGQLITTNGRVENCYVKNATIKPGEHVTGGIAGCVYDGTIENCYVVESDINGTSNRYGYIVGDSRGDKGTTDRPGTVKNCYTDNSTIRSNNVGNITDCATKSASAFASGEVTYLLNGKKSDGELVWGQLIGTDSYPVFGGETVYYNETNGYYNILHTCDFTGEWKYDTEKHWKECECGEVTESAHVYTDGVCDVCGYECPHGSWTDGICDVCAFECPHEETYETVTKLEHFSVQNSDGTWTKATISVVCRECESVIEYKEADRADYTEFDKYMARACEILETGNLIEKSYTQYSKIINNIKSNVPAMGSPFQSTPDSYIETLEYIIEELEAGIADGTMIKADFTYMAALFDEVNAVINGDASLIIPSEVGKYWGPYYYYQSQLNNANHSQASYDENMKNNNFENDLAALAAGLKDGTMLKADYTAIDEAIAEIEEKLGDVELTDEAKAGLEEIKAQLEEKKADGNTSAADLAELEKALEEYETELDAGIADGSAVKVNGQEIFNEKIQEINDELIEKYGEEIKEFSAALPDEVVAGIEKRTTAIYNEMSSLEGSVKDNEEKLAEFKAELEAIFAELENCFTGTHNGLKFEVTEEAECGKNAVESAVCTLCGETVTREVENSALKHSFTKYEVTEEAKCGVEGKKVAACDNGCGETDEKAIEALEHLFLDYIYNDDATCTEDGTKTAICLNGCGETDTVTAEDTMLDHVDEDGDNICDDCESEIIDVCPDCGGKAHADTGVSQYICMIITLIKLVVSLVKALQAVV